MARSDQPPSASMARARQRDISVSSVTRPGRGAASPPPTISRCTPCAARISPGVMNSTVAPSASPTARPRKAARARCPHVVQVGTGPAPPSRGHASRVPGRGHRPAQARLTPRRRGSAGRRAGPRTRGRRGPPPCRRRRSPRSPRRRRSQVAVPGLRGAGAASTRCARPGPHAPGPGAPRSPSVPPGRPSGGPSGRRRAQPKMAMTPSRKGRKSEPCIAPFTAARLQPRTASSPDTSRMQLADLHHESVRQPVDPARVLDRRTVSGESRRRTSARAPGRATRARSGPP